MGSSTQYTYDSYGRLTEVQYYPSWFSGTEDTLERVNYYYDNSLPSTYQSSPFTGSLNGTGRLTGVSFEGGVKDDTYDGHYWAYAYQYNTAGRVINQNVTLMATHGSSYNNLQPVTPPIATFTAGYQWDDEGRMTGMQSPTVTPNSYSSWPYPTVMPTMGYQYDVNGRMTGMTSNGSSYATASYSAAGQLLTLAYGGLTETRTYNSMMQLVTQSAPGYLNMTYNYSATQNNGRITSAVDGITGENTTYSYDALNRLTNAANSLWSEAYGYDGFGNLTSKSGSGGSPNGAPSMSVAFNANNQQTSMSYDGDGNLESVGGYPAGYSVENKLASLTSNYYPYNGGTYYAYDPHGKRMMRYTNPDPDNVAGEYNPAWEFYFYTITGQRLATMDCTNPNGNPLPSCSVVGENVYFGKKLLVSNGATVVTDRLGSVRANTQGENFAYYPYGEERTNTVNGRDKFATYLRDAVGQDYAEQRYYNGSMGRFMTADPGGIKTADAGTPLSWNRYAYTYGDPVNFLDRHGLEVEAPGEGDCDPNLDCNVPGCYDPSNEFLGQPDPACPTTGGGGDPDPAPAPSPAPPTITLQQIDDCVQPSGTGINPGAWTLFVEYQVLVNGQPVYGNSALNNLGIVITESVTKGPKSNIDITGGAGWCPVGGNCGSNAGTMTSSGDFWDMLAGQGTASQSFLFNGQPIAVSFSGVSGSKTVLTNDYNSKGHKISVGGGALVGNNSTRECGKNGDPGR